LYQTVHGSGTTAVPFIVSVCTQLSYKSNHRFDVTRRKGIITQPLGSTEFYEFVRVIVLQSYWNLQNVPWFVLYEIQG